MNEYDGRYTYLDILRIIASVAVIAIHTIGGFFYGGFMQRRWIWTCITDGNARWAVPVFVMISGAIFLNRAKEESATEFIKPRVIKMTFLFLVWSAIYGVFWKIYNGTRFLVSFIQGSHLYFLYIIVGLYLIYPFLKLIFQNKNLTKYFIILWMIFTFAIPRSQYYISFILTNTVNEDVVHAMEFAESISNIHFPVGYSGYFLLGGYFIIKIIK